jgi:hypothetical protein
LPLCLFAAIALAGSRAFDTFDRQLTGTEIVGSIYEPSTLALFVLGLGGLAWAHRRRRPVRAAAGC